MKKTIKTERILEAFNILKGAKSTNLSTDERIKVWKISRVLAPIAEKMEADTKDAAEKFKPKDEDFDQKLRELGAQIEKVDSDKEIQKFKLKNA